MSVPPSLKMVFLEPESADLRMVSLASLQWQPNDGAPSTDSLEPEAVTYSDDELLEEGKGNTPTGTRPVNDAGQALHH